MVVGIGGSYTYTLKPPVLHHPGLAPGKRALALDINTSSNLDQEVKFLCVNLAYKPYIL